MTDKRQSLGSVLRICAKRKKCLPLQMPGQKRKKIKRKTEDLSDGEKAAVRKIIYNMKENVRYVIIKIIKEKLKK